MDHDYGSQLIKAAMAAAEKTQSLDDVEKASQVIKAIFDARNLDAETKSIRSKRRSEKLQTLSNILVPTISVIALAVTIIIAIIQTNATSNQNMLQSHEQQWNEFLKGLPNAIGANDDPSFAARLKYFIGLPEFRFDAGNLAKTMMGDITNHRTFEDLYYISFRKLDEQNVEDAVDVLRALRISDNDNSLGCQALSANVSSDLGDTFRGLCNENVYSDSDVVAKVENKTGSTDILKLRRSLDNIFWEEDFLSSKLGDFLRQNYRRTTDVKSAVGELDLHELYIHSADLSNVDFTNFKLDDAILDDSNVKNAIITPRSGWNNPDMRGSNWWEAGMISEQILLSLMQYNYPNYKGEILKFKVTQQDYRNDVLRLCARYGHDCPPVFQFGEQSLQEK